MKLYSTRIFLITAVFLSFVMAVNSFGIVNLASDSRSKASERRDRIPVNNTNSETGVTFEKNLGQADNMVRYLSRSGGITTYLTDDSAWFYLPSGKSSSARAVRGDGSRFEGRRPTIGRAGNAEPSTFSRIQMKFKRATTGRGISGEKLREGTVNYLRGIDPTEWVTNVPTFGTVRYSQLYEGIDLVYYGNDRGQMEYDFEVAPGADPGQISLEFSGAESIGVDELTGDLVIKTAYGDLRHNRPVAFQDSREGRRNVTARYHTSNGNRVTFQVDGYDRSVPLTIDPVIEYSTYLGGSGDVDFVNGIAVDASGNTYMAGSTNSANFPTVSPFDGTFGGDQFLYDAFVTKMNADGSAILYSTYLGGSGDDNGLAIAVDASGQAYITGFTNSSNFPTSAGTFQNANNGSSYDGFLTKLTSNGSGLVYSTYIGGGQNDGGYSVAIDSSGFAYVGGETSSPDFPTVTPLQPAYGGGGSDGFVAKFNQAGNGLVFSTYIGGSGEDLALGIRANASGVYLAGATASSNFPTANASQGTFGGSGFFDGYVAKLDPTGGSLVFSTYLGGNDYDVASGIALDTNGNAYITGTTASANFPVVSPFQANLNGTSDDVFITKISGSGIIVYSSFLGGSSTDAGAAVAVDSAGAAYITGSTFSTNFPTVDAMQGTLGGQADAFAAKVNPAGSALVFSTYIGGSSFDDGLAIALDSFKNAYVAGGADSANFPTVAPFQGTRLGASDGFLIKLISSTTISGQVFTSDGRGLRNAVVTLTDHNGIRRQVITSSLGFYSFADVATGQNHSLSVASKRFRFSVVNVTPMENLLTVNFIGQE